MREYKLTVGLEIHAELNTKTKMFCDSKNPAGKSPTSSKVGNLSPNSNICPICMGYPGTLPVINKEAVKSILKIGVAVGGELAEYAEFDRKNYFYPDIPKGYQISQYKHPLVRGGELCGVRLTRIHLEEDTARSSHNHRSNDQFENSLLDFNRAGVPLMELVTEPVITSADEAAKFARELQLLLNYLGIADANMEKGEMRIEANISVSNDQASMINDQLGTKVEIKNLNSFRSVEQAIKFEYKRQVSVLESGVEIAQETRGWHERSGETFSQRLKEGSQDYRYFPDPDLPKLSIKDVSEFNETMLKKGLPELPWDKRRRLLNLGVSAEHAEIYVQEGGWAQLFENAAEILKDRELIRTASNFIATDLKKPVETVQLTEVVIMNASGEISSRAAKDILKIIQEVGGAPRRIAEEKNLMQISDRKILKKIVDETLSELSVSAHDDKRLPIQFMMGHAMKKSHGKANPEILQELFFKMLDR